MTSQVIQQFIAEAKHEQQTIANNSCSSPKSDPFQHGVMCGRYQGIEIALELLSGILNDEKDKQS